MQANDRTCTQAAVIIALPTTMLAFDTQDVSARLLPINGTSRQYISATLRSSIFHLCQHSLLAGQPGGRQIYDTVRPNFSWPCMANDVVIILDQCMLCARNRRINKKQRKIRLFPPAGSLDFVTIYTLGPFFRTGNGKMCILVIIDCYSKLTKAMMIVMMTATRSPNVFMEHSVANFGIQPSTDAD